MSQAGPVPVPLRSRTRLRALNTRLSRFVRSSSYLRKWLILGSLVGVIAGLGAVAFFNALTFAGHLFLQDLGGYRVPTPAGEGNLAGSAHFARPWAIPLVVGLGGLISGLLVFSIAPEAEGHGTDAAISAVHNNPREVRVRAVLVKIVASAITIGSGGSGGREGPTAQISAGFGSYLTRALDLNPSDGRILVAIGIGSGIGSIFGAPLGGALLSAEILYRDDIEVEAILPGIVASVIGYTVFSAFQGFEPLFGFAAAGYRFYDPTSLLWYALIGVIGGVIGLGYAKSFYGTAALFRRLPGSRMLKPALGGLMVGAIGLALPGVLGTGYGWIQKGLSAQLLALPLWVVLALPIGKIVATSLSIGSGGSGGIFGPGIVIGAFTGASVWRLLAPVAPGVPHDPAPFVIVGMMACFGSISRAPLAVMLMTAEMTSSLTVLAPAMIAVGLATLIVRRYDETIYRSQLPTRESSLAHRLRASMPLLGAVSVSEVMSKPRLVLEGSTPIGSSLAEMRQRDVPGAPVVDETGAFIGTVRLERLASVPATPPKAASAIGGTGVGVGAGAGQGAGIGVGVHSASQVGQVIDPAAPTVFDTDHLDIALEALMDSRANWVTVLNDHRHVVGILSVSAVVRGYRAGLRANLRRVSLVGKSTVLVDERISDRAPAVGCRLSELGLPRGTIVMTLQRAGESLLPKADTVMEAGDRVGILTHSTDADAVRALFSQPKDSTDLARGPGEPPATSGAGVRPV